jgi:Glycosyltransferase family 87
MRRLIRESALCTLVAGALSATVGWLALYGFGWNDYELEARPAFEALAHGHVLSFLRLAPAYGGSLVERAPFALAPGLWGGGQLAVYRMVALPCLLAGAVFAVWLVAHMRTQGHAKLARSVALGLCVANPLTIKALELGHPEELLGACLCVTAVLLAGRDRPLWAGVLLGLAIANKEWALLAIGPVLIALPAKRRLLCLIGAGGTATVVLAPLMLAGSGGFAASAGATVSTSSTIFQPMQVFWFLGHHSSRAVHLLGAAKRDFRLAPAWIGPISHPLVIAVALPLTGMLWRGRRRREIISTSDGASQPRSGGPANALLLLALLLLLRCMLDTWDNVYYPLPFVFALLVWEIGAFKRPPVLALSSTVLVWINVWLSMHFSADAQAAFFLTWSLPLAVALSLRLYAPGSKFSVRSRQLGRRTAHTEPLALGPTAH